MLPWKHVARSPQAASLRRPKVAPSAEPDPAIVLLDCEFAYGRRHALGPITLNWKAGEIHALLGPNGAGKTTLTRVISAVRSPSRGTAFVLGLNVNTHARDIKKQLGVVPQGITLDTELTAIDNLTSYASFFGIGGREGRRIAYSVLQRLALEDAATMPIMELSGGMQRRLLIARALVNSPRLIILDEPTTGLDPLGRRIVWEALVGFRASGATVLFSTHYMEEVEHLADSVTVLSKGKVRALGTPYELINKFGSPLPQEGDSTVPLSLGSSDGTEEDVSKSRIAGSRLGTLENAYIRLTTGLQQ